MMEEVLTHGFPAGEVSELCYCGNIIGTIFGGEKDYSEAQGSLFFNIQVISSAAVKGEWKCKEGAAAPSAAVWCLHYPHVNTPTHVIYSCIWTC